MIFKWTTEREKILRGAKISPAKKLEGIRLMNEFADRVLTRRQKWVRQKLKQSNKSGQRSHEERIKG
jgi:hypothetical protein